MASTEPIPLMAELWFEDEPEDIDRDDLLRRVHERLPDSEIHPSAESVLVAHMRYEHTYADGKRGPLITILAATEKTGEQTPEPTQTYDWDDADAVLERCRRSLAVGELYGRVHPYEHRVDAFRTTLNAAVALLRPAAVWLPHSERVIRPAALLDDPIAAFVHVRMFDVEDDPDASVMDTLGLHALGMPDFQLHFRDLEPGRVAAILYNLAAYVIEHGEVITSGHTVSGMAGDEHWRCQLEDALAGPDRLVLDVNPGDPYAAGNRP